MSLFQRKTFESLEMKNISHMLPLEAKLDDIHFSFRAGDVAQLCGDTQASALVLRMLGGFTLPERGDIFINDEPVSEMSFQEFNPYRLNIGYIFGFGGLINNLTIQNNLLFPFLYHNCNYSLAERRVNQLMKDLKFEAFANYRPSEVPGFVRKLTCVSRVMLMEPQVLLLDEPLIGINAHAVDILYHWLRDFRKSNPESIVILASEDPLLIHKEDYTVYTFQNQKVASSQKILLSGSEASA
ncbi:MAG: ATP-binding cassette domain-containing protein [Bdellovibrionales bacterium]